jgi:hypothetical protein
MKEEELPNVLFLAASQKDEVVPEISIDGQTHGALSVAFATAVMGAADINREGVITGIQLSNYVLRHIRSITDSGQHPNIRWPTPDARIGLKPEMPLVYLGRSSIHPPSPEPTTQVRFKVLGLSAEDQQKLAAKLGVELIGGGEPADLTWDAQTHEVFNDRGNKIAENINADALIRVFERKQAVDRVARMVVDRGLDLRLILPGENANESASVASDRTHASGTELQCRVTGLRDGYFALFNLTGDGKVEALEPKDGKGEKGKELKERTYHLRIRVTPPFGAEHLIAVWGENPLNHLVPALEAANGKYLAKSVVEALEIEAKVNELLVGYQGIYTSRS